MLRHCAVSAARKRCYLGRSYMSLARSWLLTERSCLPAAGQTAQPSQFQPWCSTSHRLFFEKRCFPALSKVMSSSSYQTMPWCQTSKRQKNTYYGFASRHPPKASRFALLYYVLLTVGLTSFVLTPL